MPKQFRILAAAVFLTSSLCAQAVPSLWEWAHPGAKVVAGIDVRALRESSTGHSAGQLWTGQAGTAGAASGVDFSKLHVPGMELLEDIDRVFLSSTADASAPAKPTTRAGAAKSPASVNNPPFILVLEGTFPPAHYKTLLQGPQRAYGKAAVYKTSKTGDTVIAVLNEHTLLLGDEKSVFGAIDRQERALPAPTSELLTRAAALAANSDIWLVATGIGQKAPPATPGPAGMAMQLAAQLDGLELGASLREGIRFDLAVNAKTEESAQMMASMVNSQLQMAAMNPKNQQAKEIMDKLQFTANGRRLSMHIALSKEEVEQQIQLARAARMSAAPARDVSASPAAASTAPAPAAPKPAEPQGPRKIRIIGLDEGVREIPLDPAGR